MTAGLEAAWRLFGLPIRTERLVLRLPTDDDLARLMAVAKAGIHPPDAMPFGVAWTRVARETQHWRMTLDRWRSRTRPPAVIEGLEPCLTLFGIEAAA